MEDLIKKLMNRGAEMVTEAANQIEKTIDNLVVDGKLPKEEGKKVIENFWQERDKTKLFFEDKLKSSIDTFKERMDPPTKKDYTKLEKRMKKLEKKIKKLTQQLEDKTGAEAADVK